jgi:hypothetical protein
VTGGAAFACARQLYSFRFAMGQTVFHRLAGEFSPGIVTGLSATPTGIVYRVTWEDLVERTHYELELMREFIPRYNDGDIPDGESTQP